MNKEITSVEDIYKILDDSKSSIYDKYPYTSKIKTNGRVKNLTLGRIFLNVLLPSDYPLIDEEINAKRINGILSDIAQKYPPDVVEKTTKSINEECLKMSSYYPATFNIDGLIMSDNLIKRKKEVLNPDMPPDEFAQGMVQMGKEFTQHLKDKDSGLYDIAGAGVTKSAPTDLAVFFVAKGPVAGFDGSVSKPIMNCLNDGFTLEEFYKSSDQARYANWIRSNGTAKNWPY